MDQAAAIFGAEPQTTLGGHYGARRTSSGGVVYEVVHVPAASMAEHEAQQSYQDNIQTGGAR